MGIIKYWRYNLQLVEIGDTASSTIVEIGNTICNLTTPSHMLVYHLALLYDKRSPANSLLPGHTNMIFNNGHCKMWPNFGGLFWMPSQKFEHIQKLSITQCVNMLKFLCGHSKKTAKVGPHFTMAIIEYHISVTR